MIETIQKAWDNITQMIKNADQQPIYNPKDYRPSVCSEHGGGECICDREGFIVRLAKDRLANFIAQYCKKGTAARADLTSGRIVCEMQVNDGDTVTTVAWWYLPLMYLRPRRPTFIDASVEGELWGYPHLHINYVGNRMDCLTAVEAFRRVDLTLPMSVRFWRLASLPTLIAHFQPDAYLILEKAVVPLGASMFLFWPGADRAIEDYIKKCEKQQATAAKRDAKRRAKAAAGSSHSARSRRVVPPRNQRNPNEFQSLALADKLDADANAKEPCISGVDRATTNGDPDGSGSSSDSESDIGSDSSDSSDDSWHSNHSRVEGVNPSVDDDIQEQLDAFQAHEDDIPTTADEAGDEARDEDRDGPIGARSCAR